MCGINGINKNNITVLNKMNTASRHRGPDYSGTFSDDFISLGHNLLAIREVSDISKQPYKDSSEWVLAFNGQIYNTSQIIDYLKNKKINNKNIELDKSKEKLDTYLIYKLIELEGFNFISHIQGMFAIALYNTKSKEVRLYRDSTGQKNLYFYLKDNNFIFSSEIKSILACEDIKVSGSLKINREVDLDALNIATTLGYIPGNKTLFKSINKVEPSQEIIFDLKNNKITKNIFKSESKNYFKIDKENKKESFKNALNILMREHLASKDKVSINLSGGLDSSLLLHEAARTGYSVDSYTTSFVVPKELEKNYNEDARLANILAKDYKTNHKEIKITKQDYLDNFIESYKAIEEPNYNISVPIYYITAKTEGINGDSKRVVLSGDGGDEIFGGYSYYLENLKYDLRIKLLSKYLFNFLKNKRNKSDIDFSNIVDRWLLMKNLGKQKSLNYNRKIILDYLESIYKNYSNLFKAKKSSIYENMLLDRVLWLAGENFIRSDKLYMSQSMEMRCPLSYEPFRSFCDNLIDSKKYINKNNNKLFLREYAEDVLPYYITHRKEKTGWRAPIDVWYDSDFKNLFLKIIREAKSKSTGLIDWQSVEDRIEKAEKWPKKWTHLYLSIAILSNEFKLNI